MSVRIVRHRKRIILYYSLNGKKLQMPLGIEVKVDAKGVGIDWDDKRDQLKGNAENYEAKAEIIEKIRKRANDIVFRFKEEGIDISPDLLKSELEKKVEEKVKIKTTSLVSEYEKFFKEREKIIHESEDMTDESARNYRNVFHALKDYEKQNNTVLTLSDVATTSWLNTFNVWLKKPRPKGYLTKGGLDKDSVKKRFIFLGAYLREQKEKGIIQSIHFLNEFMKKEFKGRKGEKKYKTTLT
ncbi:MAG: phage integrase SAM-like domain-containing protein, partial [Flavobacteriales bacterium]